MPLFEAPAAGSLRNAGPALHYTNSVALIVPPDAAIAARYDKQHLVPFGEFIPRGFGWFVAMMNIPLGEFARGTSEQPPLVIDGQRVAFDICYEDLFGEEIAAQVRGRRDDARQRQQHRVVRRFARVAAAPADRAHARDRDRAARCCARPIPG